MRTQDYLDAARRKLGAESNADVARALGLSRAALTKYYNGERTIDDYTAAQIAGILGVDPLRVIAQANAEREKDSQRRAYWERIANFGGMAASLTAVAGVVLLTTATGVEAAPLLGSAMATLCVMLSCAAGVAPTQARASLA